MKEAKVGPWMARVLSLMPATYDAGSEFIEEGPVVARIIFVAFDVLLWKLLAAVHGCRCVHAKGLHAQPQGW